MIENKALEGIMKKYSILFAVYFGSYGTPYFNSESDIDIAVLSSKTLSFEELNNLLSDLILYHRKSEIDLVNLLDADPLLKAEIAEKGRLLYESEEGLFEAYSNFYIKQCYELKSYIASETEKLVNRIQEFIHNER
ncbi:MAG: nucleotidyltransferase domain-containing protein [Clostridia bacterium]|nr:nucleotidyltransferase domain-containing protein [Clostridia bacterium]